jgi:phosphate transport system protein
MSRTVYFAELESVRQNLIAMGKTTLSLFDEALRAFMEPTQNVSARASELEAQTDHQHRVIHDQCLNLITLQAPVARDARLVTGILDAIVDLELIGDYCYEMVTLSASLQRRPPVQIVVQLSDLAQRVRGVLQSAIDCWRGNQPESPVRSGEAAIRNDCNALYEELSQLISEAGDSAASVDLMMICRHLERILRHALCVADQAVGAGPLEPTTQA